MDQEGEVAALLEVGERVVGEAAVVVRVEDGLVPVFARGVAVAAGHVGEVGAEADGVEVGVCGGGKGEESSEEEENEEEVVGEGGGRGGEERGGGAWR